LGAPAILHCVSGCFVCVIMSCVTDLWNVWFSVEI
jgi:hypothetical protein